MDEKQPTEPLKPLPNRTQYMADMDNFVPPAKPRHILGPFLKVLAILIIVAALAVGGLWFAKHHKSKAPVTATKTNAAPGISNEDTSVTKITAATKHYDSTNYTLGFDYPEDWTISDVANGKLTATSPALQLRTINAQNFTGQIVLTIQNQQTTIPAFATNAAVAVLESQKISYKQPTPSQRAQTYLSFVNYSGNMALIDALYITGDNGYRVAQAIPQSDVVRANPLVTVSFLKCSDGTCKTAAVPSAITMKAWTDPGLSKPILNLLESLVIE